MSNESFRGYHLEYVATIHLPQDSDKPSELGITKADLNSTITLTRSGKDVSLGEYISEFAPSHVSHRLGIQERTTRTDDAILSVVFLNSVQKTLVASKYRGISQEYMERECGNKFITESINHIHAVQKSIREGNIFPLLLENSPLA